MKPGELLLGITPKQLDADLARSFLKNPVETSVNGFLINTGTKLILRCSASEGGGTARFASSLIGDREMCLRAGMDGYVSKPITPDDLFAVIAEVLAKHYSSAAL